MGVMQRIWPWFIALLSGAMLALCYAPFNMPAMVWLGLAPLLVALWGGGGKRRKLYGFGVGYLSGLSFWLINLKWISEVGMMGWLSVAFFLSLYFALWGLFAAGAGNPWMERSARTERTEGGIAEKIKARMSVQKERRGRSMVESRRVLKFAAVNGFWWCGLEWVRGWLLTGFGWNGLGVAFHDQPILAQGADLVGVVGLSFLPVFVMAVIVQVGRGLHREVRSGRLRAHWDFGAAMALLTVFFLYGVWKLHGEKPVDSMPLNVLLVQLNIPQEASQKLWEPEEIYRGYEEETLKALEELNRRNEERGKEAMETGSPEALHLDVPDWILWPESALPDVLYYTESEEQELGRRTRAALNEVNPRGQVTMVFGLLEYEGERTMPGGPLTRKENGKAYNSLLAMPTGRKDFLTYRKQHLVLFGETIPYVDQLRILQWLWEKSAGTQYGGSFSAGDQGEPMRIPRPSTGSGDFAVIPTICFEDTVARKMRKFVKKGGQLIVNVTNDGWFKESEGAAQHFANAKFRSIELRRPTIRCANTGVSAVINSYGTVLDREKNEERKLVDDSGSHLTRGWLYATAHVPVEGPLTLYARFGDWFSVLGLMVTGVWWIAGRKDPPDGRGRGIDSGKDALDA